MEEPRHPVSGIDYPGTFQDFDKWFSSENACLEYIAKLRWPKSFICPGCGENTDKPSLMGRGLFLCRECKRQTSITAGTLFHGSHKTTSDVVSRYVVCDESKTWSQCSRIEKGPWSWQLQYCMDLAS